MRRATPIRDEDIFEVAMERFWAAPGGNDAGVRAVIEFCRNVFLDQAADDAVSADALRMVKAYRDLILHGDDDSQAFRDRMKADRVICEAVIARA